MSSSDHDSDETQPVTDLLAAVSRAENGAMDRLVGVVYQTLRELAAGLLRREGNAATSTPTALVHEAWLKLMRAPEEGWQGRAHFFGAAGRAMRQVLVEHARHRRAGRRDHRVSITLDPEVIAVADDSEVLAVDEALDRLAQLEPRQAHVVELRYFVGLSIEETAEALECSAATVKRDWTLARAWLHRELGASS